MFATAVDVATRLGRALSTAETASASFVIEVVSGLIAEAAGRDADWAEALDPVPETLRALCVEKAALAILNPLSLAAESETLGAFTHSETHDRSPAAGIFLTDEEGRRVRFAVYGSNTASPRAASILSDVFPEDA